jgi:predicted GTPase
VVAARQHGAAALVDPRPAAVGTIKEAFERYPDIGTLLPALGYGERQIADLQETIDGVDCDLVLIGTPIDLRRLVRFRKQAQAVTYDLEEIGKPDLAEVLAGVA